MSPTLTLWSFVLACSWSVFCVTLGITIGCRVRGGLSPLPMPSLPVKREEKKPPAPPKQEKI